MLTRIGATLALVLGLLLLGPTSAPSFAGNENCPGGYMIKYMDPATGTFKFKWVCPGGPGNEGGNEGSGEVKCFYQGEEIPCENQGAPWSAAHNCWVTIVDPQDPPPEGKKDEDGNWYYCSPPPPYIEPPGGPPRVWIETPPETWVNPGELAAQAVAAMNLEPIGIGIVPESGEDKLGLIGLPTWMWVRNPAENTYGPITRSASAQGVTVTATASVSKVEWDMGDGTPAIICSQGTPYSDGYGRQDSPTCGHRYENTSANQPDNAYTVTATSYWDIEWQGGGMTGTMAFTLETDTQIRVGELQVLNQ